MRFEGRVVMLSGAASGCGAVAAERFAAEGARLSLCDIDADRLAATAADLKGEVLTSVVDVSSMQDQQRWTDETVARFGRVDIAINNAGVIHDLSSIAKTSLDEYDRMMSINARGVFISLKCQIPVMREQGEGVILNTASVAGLIGAREFGAYVASKHAVVGLTKTAALEVGRHGIRVNAICPAYAQTPMLDDIVADMAGSEAYDAQAREKLGKHLPLQRVGSAREIVDVMLMICDPANSFMTGQCIAVDGGLTAN
ncbi:MAG: SDR family NAD(P)-dependent oxidoreductase [Paracoccaceae bacterium]